VKKILWIGCILLPLESWSFALAKEASSYPTHPDSSFSIVSWVGSDANLPSLALANSPIFKWKEYILALAMTGNVFARHEQVEVGHYGYDDYNDFVFVEEEPPESLEEEIPDQIEPGYTWVPGRWAWIDGQWVWIKGRWVNPPYPDGEWEPGYWEERPNGFVWISGHWRR